VLTRGIDGDFHFSFGSGVTDFLCQTP